MIVDVKKLTPDMRRKPIISINNLSPFPFFIFLLLPTYDHKELKEKCGQVSKCKTQGICSWNVEMQGIWECSYATEIYKQNRANKLSIHKNYSFCSVRKCIKNIILYMGVLCYVVDVINMDLNVNLLMRKLYMIYKKNFSLSNTNQIWKYLMIR